MIDSPRALQEASLAYLESYRQGRKQGYEQGLYDATNELLEIAETWVKPAQQIVHGAERIFAFVAGVIVAQSKTELAREQLKEPASKLANCLHQADELNRKFRKHFRGKVPKDATLIDVAAAQEFRAAIVRFRTGETTSGDELRALAEKASPILIHHHNIRSQFEDYRIPISDYIGDEALKLDGRGTAYEQGEALTAQLQAKRHRTYVENAALEQLLQSRAKGRKTLTSYIRQQKSRRRRERGLLLQEI